MQNDDTSQQRLREEQQTLLSRLAEYEQQQAEDKRVQAMLRRERDELAWLVRIHGYMLRSRDVTERLYHILDEMMGFLQAEFGCAYLVQDDQVQLRCWRHVPEHVRREFESFPAAASPRWLSKPSIGGQGLAQPEDCPGFLMGTAFGTWAYLPLVTPQESAETNKWVGSLLVARSGAEPFPADGLRALHGMTGQLARAIDHASRDADMECKYRRVIENAMVGFTHTSADGRFLLVNTALSHMLGYASAAELMASVADIGQQLYGQPERRREFLQRIEECGVVQGVEVPFYRRDRSVFWALVHSRAVRDAAGTTLYFESILVDITEHKRVEDEVHRSEARKAAILQAALDAIITIDHEGKVLEFNPAAERIFGYRQGEVLGRRIDELIIPPALRQQYREGLSRYLATGESTILEQRLEMPAIRADGSQFPAELAVTRIPVEGPPMFTGYARDITERNRAEKTLRESEEHFRSLIEHCYDSIMVHDPEGTILYLSPSVERVFGYKPEEAIGKPLQGFAHPEDLHKIEKAIADVLAIGHSETIECRVRHKDGSWRLLEAVGKRTQDSQGRTIAIVNSRDITDRQQLKEQVRQSQKMEAIGTLAGGVAHDFNNLLTVINGYSEVLLGQVRPEDPMRGMLEQIKKSGERAAKLTGQLLAFSRKQLLAPTVLNLNEVIQEMDKMLRRLIGEDIDLIVSLQPELWRVKADAGQMDQVIMNLVVNARDAMPQGGKLTIETRNVELDKAYSVNHSYTKPGPYVLVGISDTGCGMDPQIKARIFEPFFTTKGVGKGTGLGLSVVYGMVKQSEGSIEVYSELGVGTTFKLYLPRSEETPLRKSSPGIKKPTSGSETLLLVEDDAGVRQLSRMILEDQGYTVLEAANGGDALLLCEQHQGPIHLLVSDVVMPSMSGPKLAERLAQVKPTLKVLFLSGYPDEAIFHHGFIQPNTPFLQKPFTGTALGLKVRELLDH